MTFLIDEDFAMKQKLSGISVRNYSDGRLIPIAVYFRFPDTEERQRTFPHIAVDLVDVQFDRERAARAPTQTLNWDTETATPAAGFSLVADDLPLPWKLVYQLAAYSRQPWQDRQLSGLLFTLFPEMYGSLNMAAFDGTIRRADLMSVVRRDTVDKDRKRLYRNIFTVGVSSEFYANQLQYVQDATGINITFTDMNRVPV